MFEWSAVSSDIALVSIITLFAKARVTPRSAIEHTIHIAQSGRGEHVLIASVIWIKFYGIISA